MKSAIAFFLRIAAVAAATVPLTILAVIYGFIKFPVTLQKVFAFNKWLWDLMVNAVIRSANPGSATKAQLEILRDSVSGSSYSVVAAEVQIALSLAIIAILLLVMYRASLGKKFFLGTGIIILVLVVWTNFF